MAALGHSEESDSGSELELQSGESFAKDSSNKENFSDSNFSAGILSSFTGRSRPIHNDNLSGFSNQLHEWDP